MRKTPVRTPAAEPNPNTHLEREMNHTDKIKREKFRAMLATGILVAAAAVIFVLVIIGLNRIDMIRLPATIEKLLGKAETEAPAVDAGSDEQRIYASLSGYPTESEDYALQYDVDPDELLGLLGTTVPQSAYYTEEQITLTDGDKSLVRTVKLSRDGGRYRAEIYEGGAVVVRIVCDGEKIRYTDYVTYSGAVSKDYLVSDDFSLEAQLGLPSLDDILSDKNTADMKVTLLRTKDENLYCVEYSYSDLPQREIIYVSLKYGLIVSSETYYGDISVYRLTTSFFKTETVFGEDVFAIAAD